MNTFIARIRMTGGYVAKLHSDTLFGGMLWAYRDLFGHELFQTLLDKTTDGEPTFVVSDLLPEGLFPKPFLTPPQRDVSQDKATRIHQAKQDKHTKDVNWVTLDELRTMLAGTSTKLSSKGKPETTILTLHNTIDRATNTTLSEGGLYELPETFSVSSVRSLFVKVKNGEEENIRRCLDQFGLLGIGKRRSTGKGGFEVVSFEPFKEFDATAQDNAFLSLSHFVPSAADPAEGCYKTLVKYPKLDREYAQGSNPFKRPIIYLMPGSVFFAGTTVKPFYGRAIANIAPGLPAAIQGCFAFPIPFTLKQSP